MKQIAELKLPVQLLIIFFISMVGIVIGKKYAYLPWSLDVALVSFPFLMAGDYLAKYELFKNKFNITMLVAGFMWIIPLGMKLQPPGTDRLAVELQHLRADARTRNNCQPVIHNPLL